MLYCIFTYKEDAALLSLCTARLRQIDPQARIFAISDAAAPISSAPEGVELRESSFPRGGTLNGLPCIAGMLATFRDILQAEGADYVIKLDSDTWLNRLPEGWEQDDGIGYRGLERWQAFQPAGNCYRLSRQAVSSVIHLFEQRSAAGQWPPQSYYREDHMIYGMACLVCDEVTLEPYMSGLSVGMTDGPPGSHAACHAAAVVHCGEHCGYTPQGQAIRPTRAHVLMRMALLAAESAAAAPPASPGEPQ